MVLVEGTNTLPSFKLAKYLVTQSDWQKIMKNNPSHFKGCDDCPVENVQLQDVDNFLTELNKVTGQSYRLPTTDEWEYAAIGGNKRKGHLYAGSDNLDEVAWYNLNSNNQTHPVGEKAPNELGLYDMNGNVWEWCHEKALRGGSWASNANVCQVFQRYWFNQDLRYNIGFRLALSI